ncbi:MAG: efflux RND transporter periplasmic adaptor subunit [Planctomycetota bacterium]
MPRLRDLRPLTGCFVCLIALGVVGCTERNTYQAPPPPEVTVSRPILKSINRTLEFTGTTSPIELVEVRARVEGFLESVKFDEGAEVKKDQQLFLIDPKPFETAKRQAVAAQRLAEAQAKSAAADFNRAKAELDNAAIQLNRGERAAQGGAVSQGELDDLRTTRDTAYAAAAAAQAAIASAEAQVEAAQAEVAQTELDLGYTKVVSPIDGRVGEALVDVGNLVGANEPTHLTTVVRYDPIHAYYTISEADLLRWLTWIDEGKDYSGPGERAKDDFPLFLGLANEEGFPHEGRYDYADLAVDRSSGTFLIRGTFPNPDRRIPPGAFVRVQVPLVEEEALLIDERCIGRDQGGPFVLVVENKDGKEIVERRSVKLAEGFERMRIVESGLSTEDRIVVNGLQRARPGAVVRAVEAANEPAEEEVAGEAQEETGESQQQTTG